MDKGFQGTIIRVKRKRNEEPLDALTVLASATANHPQVLAPKQKKGRGFKSLSLESSTDEVTEQKDGAVSSAPETTSNATTSENIPGPNSAVDGEGGGGTAPLVFRLMDTIGLRDSSTQAARLKRGIRRSHRASRVKRGSESDAGTGTETNLSTAEELVADSQEKRRENSKTGRSQAKQAVFDKRRSDFSSGVTSSVAEEEGSIGEGTFEATAAAVTSPSVQTKAAGDPSSATKASSGSPFRPVFKPPTKKPSAARGPATTKPNAETLSGGKDSGYVAGSGMARGSLTFHMLEVQVPPKQRVLPPHPPASDATQPPRIALNGQPMHAIKTAGKHHASSGLAASTKPSVDANGALAPAKSSLAVKTPAAAATSPSSSSTPTRVLNPWESRMDQAVFAAFQSGVDASGVARALDACSGAHSSRVIQVANMARPADGTTPLMAAGWCGDELLCARLLKLGADPLAVDAHGATAWQLCVRRGAAQAGGVVKKAAALAQAARDDAEYVYDVYVLDLLSTAQERFKAQAAATSSGGVLVGDDGLVDANLGGSSSNNNVAPTGMSDNDDNDRSCASAVAQQGTGSAQHEQRMAEIALQEPLRVTRREWMALSRLEDNHGKNKGLYGGEYAGDSSDENQDDDDDDGLAWSDDGGNDSNVEVSEDSNDEAAEGNDYPDEEDDPFEAGFGEDTPPPSSDDDVVATGMVRGGLAFGLDHSDNDDDDDDDDSDRDDSDRQVMPQTHRGFPGSSMSSKSSSGNTGGFLFPNHCVGGEGTLSTAVPGASSGMATDVDMARPITFDEAFPTGIYPVDSPLPAGFTSVSAPAPHPTATLSGFSSFTTTRPALNTEVVELNESDSD